MSRPKVTAYQFTVRATVSLEIHAESYEDAVTGLWDTIAGGFETTPAPSNLADGYTVPDPEARPELVQVYDGAWRDAKPEDMHAEDTAG